MRIARFTTGDEPRFGFVEGDPGHEFLAVLSGDPLFMPARPTGDRVDLSDVRLLAPVIPRSKIVCVGRNYAEHIREMGNEVPARPLLFFKPNTAVVGPGDPVVLPEQSEHVDFEGELAVVIAKMCKNVPEDEVPGVVLGYTVANDISARDLQESDGQWARAKGFDSFCPLGPWITTDLDVSDLAVTTTLNGEVRQSGRTSAMMRGVRELVSYISRAFTLLPGDVILTGTPAGVGQLHQGDRVEVTIEGIGSLANPVVDAGA